MKNKRIAYRSVLFSLLLIAASATGGCKFKTMGPTEYGVMFSTLPWFGGLKDDIVAPGSMQIYPPWTRCYVIDTATSSITWARAGRGDDPRVNDSVNTRAGDGNEVELDVTVQYYIDATMIRTVLERVGYDELNFRSAVESWARSTIRTYLGKLDTDEFYDNERRYEATGQVQASLDRDLGPLGIIVASVIFDEHHFHDNYQMLIDEAKQTEQEAQEEENRVETVVAEWKQKLQEAEAEYNERVAKANGDFEQAKRGADAYFEARENESKGILIAGENRVKGIKEQIRALQAEGGENLVRLQFGQALLASEARFFTIQRPPASGAGNLDLTTMDLNDMMAKFGEMGFAGEHPAQETPELRQGRAVPRTR